MPVRPRLSRQILGRKKQVMEMRCFRRLLGISYRDHITKQEVKSTVRQAAGKQKEPSHIGGKKKTQKHHTNRTACEHNSARHYARKEKKRQTEEKIGERHLRLDRPEAERRHPTVWKHTGIEDFGSQVFSSAPTVDRLRDELELEISLHRPAVG